MRVPLIRADKVDVFHQTFTRECLRKMAQDDPRCVFDEAARRSFC